jgi:hypothetical protein
VNSSSSPAVGTKVGDCQVRSGSPQHRTGRDDKSDTGQDRAGRRRRTRQTDRRAGNGAGTELKRGGCAMPSSSAPCQPASQQANQPATVSERASARQSSPSPRPAEDLRGRGGTSTRHHTQGSLRGRGGWSGETDFESWLEARAEREGRSGDRASLCAVCNRDTYRQLSGVLEIVLFHGFSHHRDCPSFLFLCSYRCASSQQARLQYLWLDRVWYTWPIRLIGLIYKALDMLDHWVWCACSVSPQKDTL